MTDSLDPESRALLDREGALDEPTASELDATRLRVFAGLGLTPPLVTPPADPPSAPPAPSALPASAIGAKSIVALVVVATVATVAWPREPAPRPQHARTQHAARPSSATPTPQAAPLVASDAGAPQAARLETTPVARVAPSAPRTHGPEPTNQSEGESPRTAQTVETGMTIEDELAEQSMLVAAAEAQLRAGHASEALSLYDRSLARHPSGALRHESMAGRIAALCRLGRIDAGRSELARFLASYPRSPSVARLRSACGVEE